MTMNQKRFRGGKRGITLAGISAVALMGAVTSVWEGRSLTPYQDVVGVWTVCEGETRIEMREYTHEECDQISKEAYDHFLTGVSKLSPGIEYDPWQHAAHADLALNIGLGAYARSSVRREFNNGNYREACRNQLKYKYAGGRVFRGLLLRRTGDEDRIGSYELCLVGAVPADLIKMGKFEEERDD